MRGNQSGARGSLSTVVVVAVALVVGGTMRLSHAGERPLRAFSDWPKYGRILLVILFPRDTAAVTALDSSDFWAFNEGMSEA